MTVQAADGPVVLFVPRGNAGMPPGAGDSCDKFNLVDRAYKDFRKQQQQTGAALDPDEYCGRFPPLRNSLARVLAIECFLKEHVELLQGSPPLVWPKVGETFLGFVLERQLGEGALARVFLAREPALGNRHVAVKISCRGAFEAKTLGRIPHANIVPIHSLRQEPGSRLSVVCMPYLGEATLCDVLDRAFAGPQPPARAALILEAARIDAGTQAADAVDAASAGRPTAQDFPRHGSYVDGVVHLALQLTDALAFLHQQGVVHRDLKPSNVLVCPDGQPMILDFNLSADVAGVDLGLGGTLHYMSPEQLLATDIHRLSDPSLLDARSDIFSLGVVLYELLAGSHPFGPLPLKLSINELRVLLLQRHRTGCRRLRQACRGVDRALARVVESCLAYNPEDRPSSAAELGRCLRKHLSPLRRGRRWLAGHPRTAVATFVLMAAAGLGAAHVWPSPVSPVEYHRERAEVAVQQGQSATALHHLGQLLAVEPHNAEALFARARVYQKMADSDPQNFAHAVADYKAADDLAPHGKNKACIAYCFQRVGMTATVVFHYTQATRAGWATAEVYNNLACCYLDTRDLKDAQEALDQALRLKPRLQAPYHNQLVLALHQVSRLNGKTSKLERAPTAAEVHKEINDWATKGWNSFQKAAELGPPSTDLFLHGAWMTSAAGRQDASWRKHALDCLTKAVEHGHDPAQLKGDITFVHLAAEPAFHELLQRPAKAAATRAVRILDPVP